MNLVSVECRPAEHNNYYCTADFESPEYNFFFAGAQDNLGVKKVSAPSKNPAKCPITCFAPDKKIISRSFKIRGTLVFLCTKERERESKSESKSESKRRAKVRARARARARARTRARARARARAGKGKGKGKRKGQGKGQGKERGRERERDRDSEKEEERDSTKALAILFLNRLGQTEKNPRTIQYSYIQYCTERAV
jgi:hypothetical protein